MQNYESIKLVTKIKNETINLRRWLNHHRSLCGDNGLIIFDNNSDSRETLDLLDMICTYITVVSFSGHCDFIHDVSTFVDLYRALSKSSEYFCFLDADELLFIISNFRLLSSRSELNDYFSKINCDVILCPRLESLPMHEKVFMFEDIEECIAWGKPIISSACFPNGFVNHNIQYATTNEYDNIGGGAFMCHFLSSLPEERIRANKEKLLSFGFFTNMDDLDKVLENRNAINAFPDSARKFLNEIVQMREIGQTVRAEPTFTNSLYFDDFGAIRFDNEDSKSKFAEMIDPQSHLFQSTLAKALEP